MNQLEQPNKRSVPQLLRKLGDACSAHPDNLGLLEAKSREDLYSDIACFLKFHYDRGVFFKLEKTDLEDFLLLTLFTQRLLGLWVSLTLLAHGELGTPDSHMLEVISEVQYSEYNSKFNPDGILADFEILHKFISFKKSRVRLSLGNRKKNTGGEFFAENQVQFEFLRGNEAIEKWFYGFTQNENESQAEEEEEMEKGTAPTMQAKLSFHTRESFYKFKSE